MKLLNLIGFVSAHTGNSELDNSITIYDWVIGLPIRIIIIVGLIFLSKFLIGKWRRRRK